jgi:hypothetical protein
MRKCRAAPANITEDSQAAVGKYVNGLAGAYIDCRTKLGKVVDLVDKANAAADKITADSRRN